MMGLDASDFLFGADRLTALVEKRSVVTEFDIEQTHSFIFYQDSSESSWSFLYL
jgi:hypothetical protein